MQQGHDFTQNFPLLMCYIRNIRPLVALFTYLQETLVVPQQSHVIH